MGDEAAATSSWVERGLKAVVRHRVRRPAIPQHVGGFSRDMQKRQRIARKRSFFGKAFLNERKRAFPFAHSILRRPPQPVPYS